MGQRLGASRHPNSLTLNPYPLTRRLYSLNDSRVSRAAAEVAGDGPTYLFHRRLGIGVEQRLGRHNHPRSTEATIDGEIIDESLLQRIEPAVRGQPLDGAHGLSLRVDSEHEARVDWLPV